MYIQIYSYVKVERDLHENEKGTSRPLRLVRILRSLGLLRRLLRGGGALLHGQPINKSTIKIPTTKQITDPIQTHPENQAYLASAFLGSAFDLPPFMSRTCEKTIKTGENRSESARIGPSHRQRVNKLPVGFADKDSTRF